MRGSMLFKIGKLLCTYKWVKRLRRRWHRCRFGRRAAAAAVEYFIGRSLTKIGRGAARPPPLLPLLPPISGVMNLRRPSVFARPFPGTRVRGPARRGISPFRTPINRRIRVRRDLSFTVRWQGAARTHLC